MNSCGMPLHHSCPTTTHQTSSAMAQKESQHRETVEALNEELRMLRRQYDELTALSSNQVHLLLD
jgi:hypothetical protein